MVSRPQAFIAALRAQHAWHTRKNVCFYDTIEAARQAGYRACKRCKPDDISPREHHIHKVTAACRRIEGSALAVPLAKLAHESGLSPYHFHRIFKKITGVTPRDYASAQRARRVVQQLALANHTVTDAIYAAGYATGSRFYETSHQRLGMTPSHYKKGGIHETIYCVVKPCPLGWILVARTDKGICAIFLDDHPDLLIQALQIRFPKAHIIEHDQNFEQHVAQVIDFIETPSEGLNLALDVQGTAFQQRVWQALQSIPLGTTVSYTDIAKQLGLPKAMRAVASACGANPVAILIPCHRVVRSDGSLSGYRWGVERKRILLQKETQVAQDSEIIFSLGTKPPQGGAG